MLACYRSAPDRVHVPYLISTFSSVLHDHAAANPTLYLADRNSPGQARVVQLLRGCRSEKAIAQPYSMMVAGSKSKHETVLSFQHSPIYSCLLVCLCWATVRRPISLAPSLKITISTVCQLLPGASRT